jgi:hypothetical protein
MPAATSAVASLTPASRATRRALVNIATRCNRNHQLGKVKYFLKRLSSSILMMTVRSRARYHRTHETVPCASLIRFSCAVSHRLRIKIKLLTLRVATMVLLGGGAASAAGILRDGGLETPVLSDLLTNGSILLYPNGAAGGGFWMQQA